MLKQNLFLSPHNIAKNLPKNLRSLFAKPQTSSGHSALRHTTQISNASHNKPDVYPLPGDAPLHISYHHNLADIKQIWQSLASRSYMTVFQSHDWLSDWQAHIGTTIKCTPCIAVIHAGDQPVMLFPLGLARSGGGCRLFWLGQDLGDYNAPLIDRQFYPQLTPRLAALIWEQIASHAKARGADLIHTAKQPLMLADNIPNPFATFHARPFSAQAHQVTIAPDWEQFYASRKSAKTRQSMRAKERKLAKHGAVELTRITEPDAAASAMKQILEWKKHQLAERGSRIPFAGAHHMAFFKQFAAGHDLPPGTHLLMLTVGDEAIAGALCLEQHNHFILYQTAIKPGAFLRLSPGRILLLKMMEYAARNGPAVFDFALGDEAYKFEWADHHASLTASLQALTIKGRFWVWIERMKLAAKTAVKARPALLTRLEGLNKWRRDPVSNTILWWTDLRRHYKTKKRPDIA